jgi:carboxylesterase
MNPLRTPSGTRVLECSRPLFSQGRADRAAVLLIHGFSGSPHDMAYLYGRMTDAGYTVSVPRLPGHGTCATDFKQTGWRDWYRGAVDAYLDLRARYDRVYVAGLSMGGVITSMLAAQFDIERIALAAPAFAFTPGSGASWLWVTPLFSWAINSMKSDPGDISGFSGDRYELESEYKGWNWFRQGSELIRLRRRAVKRLESIRADSLIIVSRSDETVSPETGEFLKKRLTKARSTEIMMLEDSRHVVVDDADREAVADRIIEWFA